MVEYQMQCEKSGLTRTDTNGPVQTQKKARDLKVLAISR